MRVSVPMADDEVAALRRFCAEERISGTEGAKRLLRDALIGCGLLPLGRDNRSRHAGGSRR